MNIIIILCVFSIVGILDTLYLAYHRLKGTDIACPFFPKEWCYKVQHSPQSKTLGIPNSYVGFFMYTMILILTLLYTGGLLPFWPIQTIVTFGFLFSIYFTFIQAFVLRAFCTWCIVSAINFIFMFLAVWF